MIGQKIELPTSQRTKCRRLAIHGDHHDLYVFLKPYASCLRSLQFFNIRYSKLDFVFKDFKLLRVLDGVPCPSRALSAVGNLIQLRYLGVVLMRSHMRQLQVKLPRSIGKLKNLQTLKVETSMRLPMEDSIVKLGSLPNLKMLLLGLNSCDWTKLVCSSSEGFPQLHILHLQCLWFLEELIVEEGAMMKLKNLKISRCRGLRKIPERF
ncbi:hypothetical protein Prudu_256S000200, partial [Prunus dulcis]